MQPDPHGFSSAPGERLPETFQAPRYFPDETLYSIAPRRLAPSFVGGARGQAAHDCVPAILAAAQGNVYLIQTVIDNPEEHEWSLADRESRWNQMNVTFSVLTRLACQSTMPHGLERPSKLRLSSRDRQATALALLTSLEQVGGQYAQLEAAFGFSCTSDSNASGYDVEVVEDSDIDSEKDCEDEDGDDDGLTPPAWCFPRM